jgi:hypothetical protein
VPAPPSGAQTRRRLAVVALVALLVPCLAYLVGSRGAQLAFWLAGSISLLSFTFLAAARLAGRQGRLVRLFERSTGWR